MLYQSHHSRHLSSVRARSGNSYFAFETSHETLLEKRLERPELLLSRQHLLTVIPLAKQADSSDMLLLTAVRGSRLHQEAVVIAIGFKTDTDVHTPHNI